MIDELVHYCIEQIGLDGEAGTQVARLAHFIQQFHSEHASRSQLPDQLVDASYQAFVFRQLVSHPDVSVGLFVPGVSSKTGAKSGITKRKSSALDSPAASTLDPYALPSPEYDWVDLLPDQDLAEQQGLLELQKVHADRLRLVLGTSSIKRLLVGANDIFLPPSTFRVLQIICRSREKAVLSVDIGAALHTDQKTVFYICKRLMDLGLVTKIKARETGTTASYFVATQFEDRCHLLIQQKNADVAADLQQPGLAAAAAADQHSSSMQPSLLSATLQGQVGDSDDEAEGEVDADAAPIVTVKEEEGEEAQGSYFHRTEDDGNDANGALHSGHPVKPTFEYVDAQKALLWMSSRPELVRFRIYIVCNSTSSKVTSRANLLQRINIAYQRSQRKALLTLLEHAVVDGLLEVVNIHVTSTGRKHRGLRMTPKGCNEMQDLLRGEFGDAATLHEQAGARRLNARLQQDLSRMDSSLPRELTLERFVYEEVARAGPSGRTASQLMAQLHSTGKFVRVIEQLALRAEEADGEPSMNDLRIRSFHEHKSRVRSTKFYSHHAWVLQCANEGYLDPEDLELLASAGGTSSFHLKSTAWTAPEQVAQCLTSLSKDLFTPTPRKGARIGRPPKKRSADDDPDTPVRKRGRPRKHPIEPDSEANAVQTPSRKRGRPRKHPIESGVETPAAETTPKKRGRPRKQPIQSADASPAEAGTTEPAVVSASASRSGTPVRQNVPEEGTPTVTTRQRSSARLASKLVTDDDAALGPDSPTIGAVQRRSWRLMQEQSPVRPSSLLASAPLVAEQTTLQTEASSATTPPSAAVSPTQETVDQTKLHNMPTGTESQDTAVVSSTTSTNLSRVDDLLSAPDQVKIKAEATLPATPLHKKPAGLISTPTPSASERKRRTNLTQLRSSHALVQCVREAGGAMDTLQIPDQLSSYVERHGFASDAQLINLRDRKVREKALSAAVDNGMLRRTYIRLDRPSAAFPRRQIMYLPDLPADQLQRYCDAVKAGREGWFDSKNAKTALTSVTDNVAIGEEDADRFAKPWHTEDRFPLAELPSAQSELATLRQPFRDVISVYRQHFGFLSGEMVRLKAFHLACARYAGLYRTELAHNDASAASASSASSAALPLSFFWTDAPLDLYLAFVPMPSVSEALEKLALDPHIRSLSIHALPDELKAGLGLTASIPNETYVALYSLAMQLNNLGIVKMQGAAQGEDAPKLATSISLSSPTPMVEPLQRIPFYDWACAEDEKPLVDVIDFGLDADRINLFWAKLQACCLNSRRLIHGGIGQVADAGAEGSPANGSTFDANLLNDVDPFKRLPDELTYVMWAPRAWRPYHQLRPSQTKFLYRIDVRDIPSVTPDDIDKLAYVTLAPPQVVRAVLELRLERANEPVDPDGTTVRRQKPRFTWPLKLSSVTLPTSVYKTALAKTGAKRKRIQAEREKNGRVTTMTKARQLRQRREEEFQAMLSQAFGDVPAVQELRVKIENALAVIRRKFIAGDVRFDANAVRMAISRAIRSASGIKLMPTVRAPLSAGRRKRQARRGSTEARDQSEQDQRDDEDKEGETSGRGNGRTRRDRRSRRNMDQINFWTPARKELLRDAAVILRVRDRIRGRSDWSALFQVIDHGERTKTKSVIMAQWRNQYYRMRSLHGEEAYLAALESRWIPIYIQARQEGILHDREFPSPTGFDLAAQIELLRERIDKNEVQRSLTRPIARHHLPLELNEATDFTKSWKEEFEEEPVGRRFETVFTAEAGVASKRFETLLSTPFGIEASAATPQEQDSGATAIDDAMAEWAVRIVIATASAESEPHESAALHLSSGSEAVAAPDESSAVDETVKADFCRAVGEHRVEAAMQRLLEAKLIRPLSSEPSVRRRPGTNFVFSDELVRLLPDANAAQRLAMVDVQAMLTHRREAWEPLCDAQGEGVWVEPVLADGEAAVLVSLVQAGLVEAHVDQRAFEALRQNPAFNARVLNDEDLEALIWVRGGGQVQEALEQAVVRLPGIPEDPALGWLTLAPSPTSSSSSGAGAGDGELRQKWLEVFETTLATWSVGDPAGAERLRTLGMRLLHAGPRGILVDRDEVYAHLVELTSSPFALAFFSPLETRPQLVGSLFVHAYTLPISQFPHIWSTLAPQPSIHHWHALLHTLYTLTLHRPGFHLLALHPRSTDTVALSFADLWLAIRTLDLVDAIHVTVQGTLHPSAHRPISAGLQ